MTNQAQIKDRPLTDAELDEVVGGATLILATPIVKAVPAVQKPALVVGGINPLMEDDQCKETQDSGMGCGGTGDG